MSKYNKTFKIYNSTGYTITKLKLRHGYSMTAPHGNLLLSLDELKDGDTHEIESKTCKEGLNDYWYLLLNLMVPLDKLDLKKYDKSLVVDDTFPVAMSNSKGWKQLDVEPSDTYCHFHLKMVGSIKNAVDIKMDDDIRPSKSSPDDHWLEPVGHGGEDPLFALVYPAAPVIGTVLACIAPEVLGSSTLDAVAAAEYERVMVIMAALT